MKRVIVYNVEDPDLKEFYVGVNGTRINGPTGVEVELEEQMVEVLKNAVIDTTIRNPETNKEEPYRKERFRVIEIGDVTPAAPATPAAPVNPKG